VRLAAQFRVLAGYHDGMKLMALLMAGAVVAGAADTLQIFGHEWGVPVASDWKADQEDGTPVLRLMEHRGPLPGPRRPIQFALADAEYSGRVTVEGDVKPLGGSLLIVFAYRDAAHFDYAHLSVDTGTKQPVHNGVFHVYGGERVRISSERGPAAFSATGRWHHVKLTHDAQTGRVRVMVDGEAVPALEAVDMSLGAGRAGIGSFDETGVFKNISITTEQAPTR
jgi:hypothetical protein